MSCQWLAFVAMLLLSLPIYLVSPCWFVTREHIISESVATSSSVFLSGGGEWSLRNSRSFGGSGDVNELRGVESKPSGPDVACDGEVGFECEGCEACDPFFDCKCFSARRFSRVARSVASSSSPKRPLDGSSVYTQPLLCRADR